jgi:hypothetical protein
MAIQPVSSSALTRSQTLSPVTDKQIKTIQDIFDWLRSLATTNQEKAEIDEEEKAFLKAYGDTLMSGHTLSPNQLVNWALYGVSPFDETGNCTPEGLARGAMQKILIRHIKEHKNETLDRIIFLLRTVFHDKVDMQGRPRPPVEPAKRDARTYHAGYNDRTAYRIEHQQ